MAIAARASPMTMVLVSRVRPKYGASSRSITTSMTSTLAEEPKISAAAAYRSRPAGRRTRTIWFCSEVTRGS